MSLCVCACVCVCTLHNNVWARAACIQVRVSTVRVCACEDAWEHVHMCAHICTCEHCLSTCAHTSAHKHEPRPQVYVGMQAHVHMLQPPSFRQSVEA